MVQETKELKPQTHKRKKYITETPTIYEQQLWPKLSSAKKKTMPLDIMAKSYIAALTGPRGGVKSGSLAYLGIWAMAKQHRAITNLPIKCNLVRHNGDKEILQSEPLDIEILIMEPELYAGSLILWDEYQQFDRSGSHMTTQHQLLISQWEQIRKQEISFVYVSKRINLIPGDIAWETDLEINCMDVSNSAKGEIDGTRVGWEIKDLSGLWSRRMFDPNNPVIYRAGFYHRAIMGAYDTSQRFDPIEAKRGFKVDLNKRVISDKEEDFDIDDFRQPIAELFKVKDKYWLPELLAKLGVRDLKLKKEISALMHRMGFDMGVSAGQKYFKLNSKIIV